MSNDDIWEESDSDDESSISSADLLREIEEAPSEDELSVGNELWDSLKKSFEAGSGEEEEGCDEDDDSDSDANTDADSDSDSDSDSEDECGGNKDKNEDEEEEEEKKEDTLKLPAKDDLSYLDEDIMPVLYPALVELFKEAEENNALEGYSSRFNGLDFLAELLWNNDPMHPERKEFVPLFKIPFVKEYLEKHPRPLFPTFWVYSRDEAARIIQRHVRGWLVRNKPDVKEMRDFWKAMAKGNSVASKEELDTVPVKDTKGPENS